MEVKNIRVKYFSVEDRPMVHEELNTDVPVVRLHFEADLNSGEECFWYKDVKMDGTDPTFEEKISGYLKEIAEFFYGVQK